MIIDTNCHLNDSQFNEDREQLIKNLQNNNVASAFVVGTDLATCKSALGLAYKFDNIYAILGLYPEYAQQYDNEFEKFLLDNLNDSKVVAVGEIGLDYHTEGYDKEKQIEVFKKQIELAHKFGLPLSIHTRDAFADTLQILKESKDILHGGSIHCYSGSSELAKEFIKLGFKLGFGGVCTFKNAKKAVETIEQVDIKDILLETDAPYLAPVPNRGKRNEPKYTNDVLEKIAEIRKEDKKEIEKQILKNTENVFKKLKI